MNRSISIALILFFALLNVSGAVSYTLQSVGSPDAAFQSSPMTTAELHQAEGGVPVLNILACAALLAGCLKETEGWWADLACMSLSAFCLTL